METSHEDTSRILACVRQTMYTADRNIPSSQLFALPCQHVCHLSCTSNFPYIYYLSLYSRTEAGVYICACITTGHKHSMYVLVLGQDAS
jgi:hypothetical protein